MTPTERRAALEMLGWSQRQFAYNIGWDESTVRRWFREGGQAPGAVDWWLYEVAKVMAVIPVRSVRVEG